MDQEDVTVKYDRQANYYLWLPFVLSICLVLVMFPKMIWKSLLGQGQLESIIEKEKAQKMAESFCQVMRRGSVAYFISTVAYEVLNIFTVILCFYIIDSLLVGKFWSYGVDVSYYYSTKLSLSEQSLNPSLVMSDPMCNLFPTEIACNFCTGSIGGGCNDRQSFLCILSNNIFNQFFFLVLWFWWFFLIFLSALGLVYRALQFSIPSFSRTLLSLKLTPHGQDYLVKHLKMKPSDYFLLGRLVKSLKGDAVEEVIKEILKIQRKDFETNLQKLVNEDNTCLCESKL